MKNILERVLGLSIWTWLALSLIVVVSGCLSGLLSLLVVKALLADTMSAPASFLGTAAKAILVLGTVFATLYLLNKTQAFRWKEALTLCACFGTVSGVILFVVTGIVLITIAYLNSWQVFTNLVSVKRAVAHIILTSAVALITGTFFVLFKGKKKASANRNLIW
jgi:hypothetical protein